MNWLVTKHCRPKREDLGITQETLGGVARIASTKISRAENALCELTDAEVRRIVIALRDLEFLKKKYFPLPVNLNDLDWVLTQLREMNLPVIHQIQASDGRVYESVVGGEPGDGQPMTPEQAQKLLDEYAREQKNRKNAAAPVKKSGRSKSANAGD
jgi:hypothetical protein